VDELLVRLNEGDVYAQGYADDICLLAIGKFPHTVSGLIQWALGTVEEWCGELGLSVNPDKIGLVVFTRKRKLPCFLKETGSFWKGIATLHVGQVILDSRLTWREHVDAKVEKAHNSLWACRRACGGALGLGPRVVHWLCVCHQAVHHLRILNMVAWQSDSQRQEQAKQG
jgi:hypothetical protein